ncbi:MAG: hypothetical protein HY457_01985 [Parcubacteria group bacterium]|nr:hypothetical protein [Parcubacteria group bacterium]
MKIQRTFAIETSRRANAEEAKWRLSELSLFWRIWYRLGFCVPLDVRRYKGWTGFLPHYLFKCSSCERPSVDYPHGHDGHLDCNHCSLLGERRVSSAGALVTR